MRGTTLTVGADTVQVCFSKGLGAPVGSAVAGSANSSTSGTRFVGTPLAAAKSGSASRPRRRRSARAMAPCRCRG